MARLKRTSAVLETAHQRLAGVKSISPAPDLGAKLTLPAYETALNELGTELDAYNQEVSTLDEMQIRLETKEAAVHELNKRVLAAIEAQYGADSKEYEQAGGKRLSERKRRTKKTKTKPTS